MESHPSTPRPTRPIQTSWNVDPNTQGKQPSRTQHNSSWDSLPSTQSADDHHDGADVSPSSRLNRQQPIMIQNFELLKPSQLKFKRKSLSTANLYLSQASMHRQGTSPADFQTPENEMPSKQQVYNHNTHSQPFSENASRKLPDSSPNKILHNKFPQNRNVRNSSAKSPNSPSKQKRVTFSANNTLHRYEPKPEEHCTWSGPKHGYYNSGNNSHDWFRQRDFIYPESYNSSTLPRKDSNGHNGNGSGFKSALNSNENNNNSVNIPIRMLLDHFNFEKTRNGSKTTKDENDNGFNDVSYNWAPGGAGHPDPAHPDPHTPGGAGHPDPAHPDSHTTANNAVTPDIDDHSSAPRTQWTNNGPAIQEVWSFDRGQLDCNSTTRNTAVPDVGQMHSHHTIDKEGGTLSESPPEVTNNASRDVERNTSRQISEHDLEMNGVVERNGDVVQNRSCGTDKKIRQLQDDDSTVMSHPDTNKSESGKQYMVGNIMTPQNIPPAPKQRPSNSTTAGNVDDRHDNAIDNVANTNNSYNDINKNNDDFPDEDDNSSIVANPDDDYNDDNVDNENKTANNNENGATKTGDVVDKKTTTSRQHQQIPVSTFYDAFQEYEVIDNVTSTKHTPPNSNPTSKTGPTPFTPNTLRRKPSPNGNLLSQKSSSTSGEKNNNNNNVVSQKIIRLNFLKDIDPKSYYSKNNSDTNSNNAGSRQNGVEFEGNMAVHGLQFRSNVSNAASNKENDVSSSVRLSKPIKPNLTNNGRPPSQGDINAQFLMNFYSSSGDRKPNIDNVPFDQLSNSSSSQTLTPSDHGKRVVSIQSAREEQTYSDSDPVARSFRGREMERRLFSSTSARSRGGREQPMGSRSRSASSGALHLSVSGNGLLHKGDKPGVKYAKTSSGKGSRLHSAERFLLKTGDSRLAGRTALNLRLEELVVSRSLSSRVKLTMERAKSNIS